MALFGWRARIGFISPRRGKIHTSAVEMQMAAPDGVHIHAVDLDGPKSLGYEDCVAVLDEVGPAAKMLTSEEPADLIVMGGAPLCLSIGPDKLVDIIEQASGLPATTVMHGLVNGLRHVDAKRVVVSTPYYPEALAELLREYVEAAGFEIVALSNGADIEFGTHKRVTQQDNYRRAKKAFYDAGGGDALLLVGGGAPMHEVIEILETDVGVPVIASNFASLWNALHMANVRSPIEGYGQLLRSFGPR